MSADLNSEFPRDRMEGNETLLPADEGETQGADAATPQTESVGSTNYVYPEGFLGMMQTMMTIVVLALFILTFLSQPYRIPSASMENTLLIGDFLLVNKAVYAPAGIWGRLHLLPYRNLVQNDVVVFHYPVDPKTYVVKRVIALPGDRIHLTDGRVWVNDHQAQEPFTIYMRTYPSEYRDNFPSNLYTDPGVNPTWWQQMHQDIQNGALMVPENRYFVLGDNRNDSLDSRYWGYVPRRNVVGEPYLVYFSVRESDLPSATVLPNDGHAQIHTGWEHIAGVARWDRMFHVIR